MSVVSLIKAIVQDELRAQQHGELGVVTSIFPHESEGDRDNYECNVLLKDSGLELRKVPVDTPVVGSAAVPNLNDLVLISFVHGDLNQPIIIGRLYNDEQRPPVNQADEVLHHLPPDADESSALRFALRSGNGHDPARQVEISMGETLTLKLTDGDPLVILETGSTTISVASSGDVIIESQGKVEIAGSAGLDIKSDGAINIEAGGPMTLKGATIDLN